MSVNMPRRSVLKAGAAAAATLAAPWVRAAGKDRFKIGYVSPQTGPLAAFAEPDAFTLAQMNKAVANGIVCGGKTYAVDIIYKDSQSNPNRAGAVAAELILKDQVDLVLASATPATTNPVADQCEINQIPCITNDTPWQPYFFGRKGDPKRGFDWTYHFFWGLEDIIGAFGSLWTKIPNSRVVGALWPNDEDGNAWGDSRLGFPPVLSERGFQLVDRGRFQSPINDFSTFINDFKKSGVDIVTGVVAPPDFANFWNQCGQLGFQPKIVTVAKATEFPAGIAAFGKRAEGLSVEVFWSPAHPFSSSVTGQSSRELAAQYSAETGRSWSMSLGFKHSLFEVALDVLKRAGGKDPDAIRSAIAQTRLDTVVGRVDFSQGPVPNIARTPLVTGQWQQRGKGLDLVIVDNSQAPMIAIEAELQPIRYS